MGLPAHPPLPPPPRGIPPKAGIAQYSTTYCLMILPAGGASPGAVAPDGQAHQQTQQTAQQQQREPQKAEQTADQQATAAATSAAAVARSSQVPTSPAADAQLAPAPLAPAPPAQEPAAASAATTGSPPVTEDTCDRLGPRVRVSIKFKVGMGWRGTKARDFPGRFFRPAEKKVLREWGAQFWDGCGLYTSIKPQSQQQQVPSSGQGAGKSNEAAAGGSQDCVLAADHRGGTPEKFVPWKDDRVVILPPNQAGYKRRKPFVGVSTCRRPDAFLWFRSMQERLLHASVIHLNVQQPEQGVPPGSAQKFPATFSSSRTGRWSTSATRKASAKRAYLNLKPKHRTMGECAFPRLPCYCPVKMLRPHTITARSTASNIQRGAQHDEHHSYPYVEVDWDPRHIQDFMYQEPIQRVSHRVYVVVSPSLAIPVIMPDDAGLGAYFNATGIPPGMYNFNGTTFTVLPPARSNHSSAPPPGETSANAEAGGSAGLAHGMGVGLAPSGAQQQQALYIQLHEAALRQPKAATIALRSMVGPAAGAAGAAPAAEVGAYGLPRSGWQSSGGGGGSGHHAVHDAEMGFPRALSEAPGSVLLAPSSWSGHQAHQHLSHPKLPPWATSAPTLPLSAPMLSAGLPHRQNQRHLPWEQHPPPHHLHHPQPHLQHQVALGHLQYHQQQRWLLHQQYHHPQWQIRQHTASNKRAFDTVSASTPPSSSEAATPRATAAKHSQYASPHRSAQEQQQQHPSTGRNLLSKCKGGII